MLRLLTNIQAMKQHAPPDVSVDFEGRPSWQTILRAIRSDGVLLANPGVRLMIFSILVRLLSAGTTQIYFYDILLAPPAASWKRNVQCWIRKLSSRLAARIYLVHHDYETYARELSAPLGKFQWIGFKCNNFERLTDDEPKASIGGDYVLACGQSYRDYPTFIRAFERLPIPARIILPPRSNWDLHGTWFDEAPVPENVTVIEHDGGVESWDTLLRNARLVVLPLRKDVVQPAGISVALEAMAFGKAVIMSDGPLTRGGTFAAASLVVPPGDPQALAEAMGRVWNDEGLRRKLADGAVTVARAMGGVRRMCADLFQAITADLPRYRDAIQKRQSEVD
ncbi:MAG: glycosyltransferase [Thiohalomonadaceae bacterium]